MPSLPIWVIGKDYGVSSEQAEHFTSTCSHILSTDGFYEIEDCIGCLRLGPGLASTYLVKAFAWVFSFARESPKQLATEGTLGFLVS